MTQQQSGILKAVQTIHPQAWMRAAATLKIMQALQDNGAETQALFVGGCVRNAILELPPGDIDIATVHTPPETIKRLESAGIKAIPTGIDHGTITGVVDGQGFEITTLRKDVETDGRRAVVAFTQDWAEDAQRRDFTMNTLLMDTDGNIYDLTGQGLRDLKDGRVIFVGQPNERIAEDYLRILRFFRFHGAYGTGAPDASALMACKAASAKIVTLSKERITQEFFKILALDNAADILWIMFDNMILEDFSENTNQKTFANFCNLEKKFGLESISARLFMLAGLDTENLEIFEKLIILPKMFTKDIQAISDVLSDGNFKGEHNIQIIIYKFGRTAVAQALLIQAAQGRYKETDLPQFLKLIKEWEVPVMPVTGDDLIRKGMKPGPELGRELARLEKEWISRGFKA